MENKPESPAPIQQLVGQSISVLDLHTGNLISDTIKSVRVYRKKNNAIRIGIYGAESHATIIINAETALYLSRFLPNASDQRAAASAAPTASPC
jgi:hypothetical protein